MSGNLAVGASDFFDLAERKLDWLGRRDAVIAGNVANSNTPGYTPHDLAPFASTLSGCAVGLARTEEGSDLGAATGADTVEETGRETSPDGNGVSLDHELTMLSQTEDQQGEVTTLYKRYTSMVQTALGLGGGA